MITTEFRQKVREAILEHRENYPTISDAKFANMLGISSPIFSRLKNGETEKLANDSFWIEQGRKLNVSIYERNWKVARTSVYAEVEQSIKFCKQNSKAIIFTDDCGIGKTFCTKHVIKNMPFCYYVDCSQAPTKSLFIRHLARVLGVDSTGRLSDVKENVKYYINLLNAPFIALDDAGYLDPKVFVEIIELWNATEGRCGWMMIGDDSLQSLIEKGLKSKKVGFRALFSRFSDEFVRCVPVLKHEKQEFLRQLIGDVAQVNMTNHKNLQLVVNKCIGKEKTLRHLETLIKIESSL